MNNILVLYINLPFQFTNYQLKNTECLNILSLINLEILKNRRKGIITREKDIKNNSLLDYKILKIIKVDDFKEFLISLLLSNKKLRNDKLLDIKALFLISNLIN
jgi:hypothetical protein